MVSIDYSWAKGPPYGRCAGGKSRAGSIYSRYICGGSRGVDRGCVVCFSIPCVRIKIDVSDAEYGVVAVSDREGSAGRGTHGMVM